MTESPPHYLRHNRAEWSPRRVVCLDTESMQRPTDRGNLHTFRLGCASYDHRVSGSTGRDNPTEETTARSPADLWEWIVSRTDRSETTYAFAHNLAFDLTCSQGLPTLVSMGFAVTSFSTVPRAPFVHLARGRRRLVLCDSVTWFGCSIAELGRRVGLDKLAMPSSDGLGTPWTGVGPRPDPGAAGEDPDGVEAWAAYCRRDVEILRAAVMDALGWWDASRGGRWHYTGAMCGWAFFRHRHYSGDVLIHRNPAATKRERRAYYGGRREAFRIGEVPGGPFAYLDFRAHYPDVARRHPVPVELQYTARDIPLDRLADRPDDLGVIADVEVTTDVPCAPVRTPRGVAFPVGTYRTTLCGPELDLVLREATRVRVVGGSFYRLAPALEQWATWIIAASSPQRSRLSPVCQLMAKTWSRSVIGKFGQAGRSTRRMGDAAPAEFSTEGLLDLDSGDTGTVTRVAGSTFETWTGGEPENAAPAVAAWIASAARVELWDLMKACGTDAVSWCDTDAVMVDGRGAPDPRDQAPPSAGDDGPEILAPEWWVPEIAGTALCSRLAVKAVHRSFTVHLPGDYEVDGRPVVKGLPAGARMVGPRTWHAELWPGVQWQLENHRGVAFETWHRRMLYRAPYDRGYVQSDGRVLPLELHVEDGENVITPFESSRWAG